MYSLAVLYTNGKDVPQDIAKAHALATLSRIYGYKKSDNLIAYIEKNVKPEQLEPLRENTRKLIK